jgi:hypothetical protein
MESRADQGIFAHRLQTVASSEPRGDSVILDMGNMADALSERMEL